MIDKSKFSIMSHILIRDPDTDETILRQRDAIVKVETKPEDGKEIVPEDTSDE